MNVFWRAGGMWEEEGARDGKAEGYDAYQT